MFSMIGRRVHGAQNCKESVPVAKAKIAHANLRIDSMQPTFANRSAKRFYAPKFTIAFS